MHLLYEVRALLPHPTSLTYSALADEGVTLGAVHEEVHEFVEVEDALSILFFEGRGKVLFCFERVFEVGVPGKNVPVTINIGQSVRSVDLVFGLLVVGPLFLH